MRGIVKTVAVVIAALLGTALLAVTTTFTAAVTLSATAIIVPGTGTPDPTIPTDYMNNAVNYYVIPNAANTAGSCDTSVAGNTCTAAPVKYYAQFWPIPLPGWGGLEGQKWNVSVGDGRQEHDHRLQRESPSARTSSSATRKAPRSAVCSSSN